MFYLVGFVFVLVYVAYGLGRIEAERKMAPRLAKLHVYEATYDRSDMNFITGLSNAQPGDRVLFTIDGGQTICEGTLQSDYISVHPICWVYTSSPPKWLPGMKPASKP